MADEYGYVGGRRVKVHSDADDAAAGTDDSPTMQKAKVTDVTGLAKKATGEDHTDTTPKASDYKTLGEWSAAMAAHRKRKAEGNPQAQAVSNMLKKKSAGAQ